VKKTVSLMAVAVCLGFGLNGVVIKEHQTGGHLKIR